MRPPRTLFDKVWDRHIVVAETADTDGTQRLDSKPQTFRMEVKASILVEELQPIQANCGAPAVRALAGVAYRVGVRAAGIVPVRWDWTVANVNGQDRVSTWSHDADPSLDAGRDVLGDGADEPVIFDPVPNGDQYYVAAVRVVATDAQGNTAETALPLSVHRPFEVAAYGARVVAERFEPFPASGCTPGSIETRVTYSETKSESRQRSVSVTVSQEFATETGVFCAQEAMRIFGGYSYSTEYEIERFYRDVRHYRIGEGSSEVHRMVISRELLK
jgi:hypothetical protein